MPLPAGGLHDLREAGSVFLSEKGEHGVLLGRSRRVSPRFFGGTRLRAAASIEGDKTDFTYDTRRWLSEVIDPIARRTRYNYLPTGEMYCQEMAVQDPVLHQAYKHVEYDGLGTAYSWLPAKSDPDVDCNIDEHKSDTAQADLYNRFGTFDTATEFMERPATRTFPDGTFEAYTYDENGNRLTKQNRYVAGEPIQVISWTYDHSDRIQAKTTPESHTIYTYDLRGRQTRADVYSQAGGSFLNGISQDYDFNGRLIEECYVLAAFDRCTSYTYTKIGVRRSITWPDGYKVTYGHLVTGEILEIKDPNGAFLTQHDAQEVVNV